MRITIAGAGIKKPLLEEALSAPFSIISVMGDHAGEGVAEIFGRKIEDISKLNRTFWLVKSPKSNPNLVQELCRNYPVYVLFIEPAAKGGARPTVADETAKEFSKDGTTWRSFPANLGPVTGKIDSRAYALLFDELETVNDLTEIDIWNYADFNNQTKPIKMILGCSTVCAVKKDMKGHPEKMKSRFRRIVAVARLTEPYCVWVK